MARRHHYRGKDKTPPELDITTFMNLMVVLVPFLLISAVFSRITILQLKLPEGSGGATDKQVVNIEVTVREKLLQIGNGKGVIANIPKVDGKYDYKKLSQYLLKIKKNYPKKTDATILMAPNIEYNYLVQTMDAVRSIAMKEPGQTKEVRAELFPDISIGQAP
ncbi:MAG: biopolymer transporter ExbD [Gammaproteobacteria bacterium]|jgi:biopolymer transport protein ExbD